MKEEESSAPFTPTFNAVIDAMPEQTDTGPANTQPTEPPPPLPSYAPPQTCFMQSAADKIERYEACALLKALAATFALGACVGFSIHYAFSRRQV
ncbi:hypothetical protein [Pleurochrysis sp. endemic virus 2]|nr:hypothetical protein [Pleurochrysis sp. endemic virus 2]